MDLLLTDVVLLIDSASKLFEASLITVDMPFTSRVVDTMVVADCIGAVSSETV